MNDSMLAAIAPGAPETVSEVIPLGEVRMVREDCWREVHRLFHRERRSKAEIVSMITKKRGILDDRGVGVSRRVASRGDLR